MPRWKRQAYKPGQLVLVAGSQRYHTLCSSRHGGLTHWGFSQAFPSGHLPTSYLSLGNQTTPMSEPRAKHPGCRKQPKSGNSSGKGCVLGPWASRPELNLGVCEKGASQWRMRRAESQVLGARETEESRREPQLPPNPNRLQHRALRLRTPLCKELRLI